jgi:hypothetical protein
MIVSVGTLGVGGLGNLVFQAPFPVILDTYPTAASLAESLSSPA